MTVEKRSQGAAPLVIGLLAGVGAGKTTVARMFEAEGFVRLDADQIAREVVALPAIRAQIRDRFGDAAFAGDDVDRAAMARIVFANQDARRDLEAITHPRIRAILQQRMQDALDQGHRVLLDVPLLLEGGLIEVCDRAVFVEASEANRRLRTATRGWEEGELARRESNQATLAEKRAACQFVIRNDGDLSTTQQQVRAIITELERA